MPQSEHLTRWILISTKVFEQPSSFSRFFANLSKYDFISLNIGPSSSTSSTFSIQPIKVEWPKFKPIPLSHVSICRQFSYDNRGAWSAPELSKTQLFEFFPYSSYTCQGEVSDNICLWNHYTSYDGLCRFGYVHCDLTVFQNYSFYLSWLLI